jgi:hypothetical protein
MSNRRLLLHDGGSYTAPLSLSVTDCDRNTIFTCGVATYSKISRVYQRYYFGNCCCTHQVPQGEMVDPGQGVEYTPHPGDKLSLGAYVS